MLSPRERRQALALLGLVMCMAVVDMIGVASILPFVAVLTNPEIIQTNELLSALQGYVGLGDQEDFLWFLGVAVLVLLILSLALKALTAYAQLQFTLLAEYNLGRRLMEGYLRQPYVWFLSRNSADIGKMILSEVTNVVHTGLVPMVAVIAQGSVMVAIVVLLFLTDPILCLTVCSTLGLTYVAIYHVLKGKLRRLGEERLAANEDRFIAINEAFSGIKQIKARGFEHFYVRRFAEPAERYARHNATANIVSQLPRFLMEAVTFGGLMLIILVLMAREGQFIAALPVIALYAFAGYRLMPALQQVYSGFAQLRFVGPALDTLHDDLHRLQRDKGDERLDGGSSIELKSEIRLSGAHFAYPDATGIALHGIDMQIQARTTIGLVGPTGSGKTTLVDVMLGLLEPQTGSMAVDGQAITPLNCRSWQRTTGYVPQQIHLTDGSVAANIALGVEPEDIDIEAVVGAAKVAHLHEFVDGELPQKYDTSIGEQGVRLSGGQRQRIGIARALYHSPSLLILDEATSALDNLTEQAVMEAVNELRHEITIIQIAHRLRTVRACDRIFMLEKGQIVGEGTYLELIESNERFRTLAEA